MKQLSHWFCAELGLVVSQDYLQESPKYVVSNNHVIARMNQAYVGDGVIHPGDADGGIYPEHNIARVYRWVPLNFEAGGSNQADIALAKICGGANWEQCVLPHVMDSHYPTGLTSPKVGMEVVKYGRTTMKTYGVVTSVSRDLRMPYELPSAVKQFASFQDQIVTTSMASPGDSGAALIDKKSGKAVGFVFGGRSDETYSNDAQIALGMLSKNHTTDRCSFSKVAPFFPWVFKRRFSTACAFSSAVSTTIKTQTQPVLFRKALRTRQRPLAVGIMAFSFFSTRINPKSDLQSKRGVRGCPRGALSVRAISPSA